MPHTVTLPDGHEISDDRARLDMEFVHASLADAYWARGRSRDLTERSWAHCLCLGLYAPNGAPAGFARVLTDYTFRAHLADVFIRPASRGLGLGVALVDTILRHPELGTVTHWTLTTADAQELYTRFGFRRSEADDRWMTRTLAQSTAWDAPA
ncbi:GNAT family N-acetyltransferase [Roseomonas elaeocarpi]|uniref:GNAT family N-acetyltransferase n=1 Tax=Roseomonas elaeocarpi TaxID=907779 RepID=A0ABV6JY40_9PROT